MAILQSTEVSGSLSISGSLTAQSFVGDGSSITGVISEAPAGTVSGSAQVVALLGSHSGTVGIGTASPTHILDITTNRTGNGQGSTLRINRPNNSSYENAINWATGGTNKWFLGSDNDSTENFYLYNWAQGSFALTVQSSNNNVGIGTTSPAVPLHVVGNIYSTTRVQGGSTTIGSTAISSTNFASIGSNSSTVGIAISRDGNPSTYPDLIINSSGNVGIGTSSPSSFANYKNLSIKGGSSGANLDFHNSSGTRVAAIVSNPSTNFIVETNEATPFILKTNDTERMRIDASGNVGIGTTSPDSNLHVFKGSAGTVTANSNSIITAEYSANGYISVLVPDANESGLLFGRPTDAQDGGIVYNSSGTSRGLQFRTAGNSTKMVINSSGNVGIGTTSPNNKLEISDTGVGTGSTHLKISRGANVTAVQRIAGIKMGNTASNDGSNWIIQADSSLAYFDNANLNFIHNSAGTPSTRVTMTYDGNVGIGTTSPVRTLHVDGGSGPAARFQTTSDGTIELVSTNSWTGIKFADSGGVDEHLWYNGTYGTFALGGGGSVVSGKKLHIDGGVSIGSNSDALSVPTDGLYVEGDLTVGGKVTAQEFHTEFVSASIIYTSGSTKFGDTSDDNHNFTGSLNLDGNARLKNSGRVYLWKDNSVNYIQYNKWNASSSGGMTINNQASTGDLSLQTNSTTRLFISASGNVGIGTTSPLRDLHVKKANSGGQVRMEVFNTSNTSNSHGVVSIYSGGASGGDPFLHWKIDAVQDWSIGIDNSDSDKLKISKNFGPGINDYMTFDTSGNVGIGTTSPSYLLDVVGPATALANQPAILGRFKASVDGRTLIRVQNNSVSTGAAATAAGLSLQAFSNSSDEPESSTHEAQILLRANNNSQDGELQFVAPRSIRFNVDAEDTIMTGSSHSPIGSNAMYISSSGNVGIGTTSPANDVSGLHISVASSTDQLYLERTGSGTGRYYLGAAANSLIIVDDAQSAERMRIDSSGNVGIGTQSPASVSSTARWLTLNADNGSSASGGIIHQINGTTKGTLYVYNDNVYHDAKSGVGHIFAVDNGTEAMRINSSANVGIGRTSPVSILELGDDTPTLTISDTGNNYNDGDVQAVVHLSGRWYSGTANPASDNYSDARIVLRKNSGDGTGGSSLAFETSAISSGGLTEAIRIDKSQNVGIGTTSPDSKLHVSSGDIRITNNSPSIYFYDSDVSGLYHRILGGGNKGLEYAVDPNNATAGYHRWDIGGSVVMKLIEGGNLGIGTTTPDSKLHLQSASATGAIINLETTHTGGIPIFNLKGAHSAQVRYQDENGNNQSRIDFTDSGSFNFIDATSSTSHMYISTAGNVGIGTTSPTLRLDVRGTQGSPASSGTSQVGSLSIRGTGSHFISSGMLNVSPWTGWFQSQNANDLSINYPLALNPNGGNVGIGTTSPSYPLDILNNSTRFSFQTSAGVARLLMDGANGDLSGGDYSSLTSDGSGNFSITTGNAERFRVEHGGNVGVGTTSPTAKLHVSDASGITIENTATTNVQLKLRSNGVDTWRIGQNLVVTGSTALEFYDDVNNVDRMVITNTGNVGIGTTTPDAKLRIKGTGGVSGLTFKTTDASDNETFFIQDGGRTGVRYYPLTVGIPSSTAAATSAVFQVEEAGLLTVLTSGNVGIGTTSPGAKLHNYSTATSNVFISGYGTAAQNNWGAGHAFFVSAENGIIVGKANAQNDTNRLYTFYNDASGNAEQYIYNTNNTATIKLDSAGDSYFNGGNVGIGTTSPTSGNRLHIKDSDTQIELEATGSGTSNSGFVDFDGTSLQLSTNRDNKTGTFHDSAKSHASVMLVGSAGGSHIRFNTVGSNNTVASERLRITAGGNVGIGTTNPNAKFDVVGDVNSSNNIVSNTTYTLFTARSTRTTNDYGGLNKQYVRLNLVTPGSSTTGESAAHGFGDLRFQLANTSGTTSLADIMTLRYNGKVGIGVTTPESSLSLKGNQSALDFTRGTSGDSHWYFSSDSGKFYIGRDDIQGSNNVMTFVSASGNVGIGTTSPDDLLELVSDGSNAGGAVIRLTHGNNNSTDVIGTVNFANNVGSAAMIQGGTTGANNTGYISFFTDNAGSSSEKMRILGAGNVGIGTTNPNSLLELNGSNKRFQIQDGTNSISIGQWDGSTNRIEAGGDRKLLITSYSGGIDFGLSGSGGSLTIDTSGKVGIGTTSPTTRLTVYEPNGAGNGSAQEVARFANTASGATSGYLYLGASSGTDWLVGKNVLGTSGGADFQITTHTSSPALVINSSTLNVGIGTTSPNSNAKLHVEGPGKFYSTIGDADNVRTGLAHYDNSSMGSHVGGQIVLGYKYDTGGTYTEGAILKMYKENGTSGQYGSGLKFQVRNHGANLSTKMILDPSGNLGIGNTTTPEQKLHIIGSNFDSTSSGGASTGAILLRGGTSGDGNTTAGIGFGFTTGTAGIAGINDTADSDRIGLVFYVHDSSTGTAASSEAFRIGSDKNVSMTGQLTITKNADAIVLKKASNVRNSIVFQNSSGTDLAEISVHDTGNNNRFYIYDNVLGNYLLYSDSNSGDIFVPNGDFTAVGDSRAIKVQNSSGNTAVQLLSDSSGDGQLRLNDSSGNTRVFLYAEGNGDAYINTGGNVGIGTTSPSSILTIKSTGDTEEQITVEQSGNTNTIVAIGQSDNGNSCGAIQLNNINGAIGTNLVGHGASYFTGNLGVGTTSPQSRLQVNGSTNAISAHFGQGTANGNGTWGGISLGYSENNTNYRKVGIVAKAIGDHSARQELHFLVDTANDAGSATLSDSKMVINTSGSVGIGTTSPTATLQVEGSGSTIFDVQGSQGQLFSVTDDLTGTLFSVNDISGIPILSVDSDDTVTMGTFGENTLVVTGSNVGIGTTSPAHKLDVVGTVRAGNSFRTTLDGTASAAVIYFGSASDVDSLGQLGVYASLFNIDSSNGPISFKLAGSEKMRVHSDGNVGIGTTSPAKKLHVHAGSISDIAIFQNNNGNFTLGQTSSLTSLDLAQFNAFRIRQSSSVPFQITTFGNLDLAYDLDVGGALSKGSGTFKIKHPDPEKNDTQYLHHSFVESPTAGDNIYRWQVEVVDGTAEIELPDYYKFLNENDQVWITPVKHFGQAYGEINEEQTHLTVTANADGIYNVLCIGTRKDEVAVKAWRGVERNAVEEDARF